MKTLYGVLGDLAAAEDCVQEAFLSAYRAWPKFRPERPAEAWLHRIAINTALSYRRRRQRREVGELIRRLGRPGPGPDPSRAGERSDLIAAMSRLPPKLAVAFILRHYHGYSAPEIAELTGSAERTVRLHIEQAGERLRRALGPGWNDPLPKSGAYGVVMSCGEGTSDG